MTSADWVLSVLGVLAAGIATLLVSFSAIRRRERNELLAPRRALEEAIIQRRIEQIKSDPDAVPAAINDLRELQLPPAAPVQPATDGGRGLLKQLTAFPSGGAVAQLGYRIFKWLLALAIVILAVLTVYAIINYPSDSDVTAAAGSQATPADRLAAFKSLQSDWLQQVKDLGQLFLLTPVFPLIGTVIGYIFGVRKANGETGELMGTAGAGGDKPGAGGAKDGGKAPGDGGGNGNHS